MTKGARGSLACEKAVHIAQAVRERWHTLRFFPVRSRAHFRVFSRLALLASLVVGLTFTVEVTLNKLLKDRGYWRVEIVIKVGGVLGWLVLIWLHITWASFLVNQSRPQGIEKPWDEDPRCCGYDWLLQATESQDREISNVPFFHIYLFRKHNNLKNSLWLGCDCNFKCSLFQSPR